MAFGARVLKTGIAVALALYVCSLLEFTAPVIAAVAAIFAMQPSIYRSWRYFIDQIQTNTLGATLAMVAGSLFSNDPFFIGLVCVLVIMICLKLKMEETIGLTLVTVIAVMEASGQWQFALSRFILSLIGIGSAFLINILFIPPKPKEQFVSQVQGVFSKLSLLLRTFISDEIKENVFRDEKESLDNAYNSLAQKYNLFEEELKKLKRPKYSRIRHLVVYKQMLSTVRKGIAVLEAVEEHYFQSAHTPDMDRYFDNYLERLTKYHEHVMLKFDDKLKPEHEEAQRMEEANEEFMRTMIEGYNEGHDGQLRLSIVAAAMYDYCYQIGRLDKLVEQFNKGPEDKDTAEKALGWFKGRQ
ncbi:FUSC family protein [Paenibacillus xerothermodurans]|uniref:Aromatic acid exporter family protein n=1 Tax=Paenibacillus xerothermodurans TaxID=1977292 RepID=A0A2W1ND45_PAEXE|nr:aromatic acid exporter family protein [Paenibacillus xerothermodurans]PZE21864.1 aromatic acid exporter family protein [Paenibacillus xerothermodurans]